jgi:hypothetical protein
VAAHDELGLGRSTSHSDDSLFRPLTFVSWLLRTVILGLAIVIGLMMLVNKIS